MLRKLSRRISHSATQQPPQEEPDFFSRDAATPERVRVEETRAARTHARQASEDRDVSPRSMPAPFRRRPRLRPQPSDVPSVVVEPPSPSSEDSSSDEAGQICPFYLDTTLEALTLEPLVRPTFKGVRDQMLDILPPAPRRPSADWVAMPTMPEPALLAAQRRASEPTLLRTIPEQPKDHKAPPHETPIILHETEEEESESETEAFLPMPQRPLVRRNAVSYRTQRDVPLRVQAVRRAQQEAMARALTQRPLLAQVPRRATDSSVPTRQHYQPSPLPDGWPVPPRRGPPPRQPLPPVPETEPLHIRRRVSHAQVIAAERGTNIRRGSTRRRDYFAEQPQEMRDFYLESAMSSWDFKL